MPTCKYFIGKTFAHIAGGLAITGVSAQYPIVFNIVIGLFLSFGTIGAIIGIIIIALLPLISYFILLFAPPNTFAKYAAAALFVFFTGQLSGPLVSSLEKDNLLVRVLGLTTGLFLGMVAVGFYDSQNMLKYHSYVIGALIGLVLVELILDLLIFTNVTSNQTPMRVVTFIGVGIFALLTGIDVQVLKEHAKACTNSPDYVKESISLFLDYINMFQKIGYLTEASS